MQKIYLYDDQYRKFYLVDENDEKLNWTYPYTPQGMVYQKYRKDFRYLYFGETKEECIEKANALFNKDIDELKSRIDFLKKQLHIIK